MKKFSSDDEIPDGIDRHIEPSVEETRISEDISSKLGISVRIALTHIAAGGVTMVVSKTHRDHAVIQQIEF
jgi:predicted small metal-binding protein